jgi:hypothetical protein
MCAPTPAHHLMGIGLFLRTAQAFCLTILQLGPALERSLKRGTPAAVLRRLIVFLHVTGQLLMRLLMFAYMSVAQAEKAIPLFLAYGGIALIFSINQNRRSGWVVSTLFTFPLWFLSWQASNSSNLFGWKKHGPLVRRATCFCQTNTAKLAPPVQWRDLKGGHSAAMAGQILFRAVPDHAEHLQDYKTRNLRLMILWRFLENLTGFTIVYFVPPITPCTPSASNVRYLSEYCMTCCRGPIMYFEFTVVIIFASGMYALSWVAGWLFDNFYVRLGD